MTDEEAYQLIKHYAEIDTRFLSEGLVDYRATLKLYGINLNEEQLEKVAKCREQVLGQSTQEIQAKLSANFFPLRP